MPGLADLKALPESLRRAARMGLRLALSQAGQAWKPRPAAEVRRILVVEMTRLGDLVSATALFAPLRSYYPLAALEVAGAEAYAPLFEGSDILFHGLPAKGGDFLSGLRALRPKLRGGDLLVLSASPALRNSLIALASRPGRACGYLFPEGGSTDYDAGAPLQSLGGNWSGRARLPKGEHMVARAGRALSVAGMRAEHLRPSLGAAAPRQADKVLLHAGANWDRRRWPLERFLGLAESLAKQGYRPSLIPAEAGPPPSAPPGVRVLGALGLAQLRDEAASAALFVGNDSGPLHLAAALGTPCLGLFGPNLAANSGPWPLPGPGSPHQALWEEVPCRPCGQLRCVQPWDWCMEKLSLARVEAQALSMLAAAEA
ncbi:MAG TPA: glycosyltransferase family 9 protein [bacterium]|jgi:ADP-heptose:LPS heptosyltransferase|nr:glycosyltransferase family 9 protein [bacterium]